MEMENLKKGPWFEEEDEQLKACVAILGERRWDSIAKISGLRRSGKSCRLRWLNYLRPNLKQGPITNDEELIILQLHERWGNKWAKIARRLPGRTDNEIKNYWRTHLRRKMQIHKEMLMQNQNNMYFLSIIPFNKNISSSSRDQTKDSNRDSWSTIGNTFTTQVNVNGNNEEQSVETYNNNNKSMDEASNYLVTNLPYENYLSHYISNRPSNELNDESSVECMGNNASDICFDYPITCNQGYDGACHYSYDLWDMDYFNVASFVWS